MKQLKERLPLSESHIYGLMAVGLFPPSIPITPLGRARGWFEDEIDAWLQARLEQFLAEQETRGVGAAGKSEDQK